MQFKTIVGLDQGEQAFGSFLNKTGAASVLGRVVVHDLTTARDGKSVIAPTTALLSAIAGVMVEADKADGETVLCGTYGIHNALVKGKVGSGGNTVAGDILIPVNGEYNFLFSAAGDGKTGIALLADANVAQDAAAALKKVYLRTL